MAHPEVKQYLIAQYFKSSPDDAARTLSTFDIAKANEYLKNQDADIAAEILSRMNPDEAASILELVDAFRFKELLDHLNVFFAARLISRFGAETINIRLENLSAGRARQIRELINYPSECAAFMMDTKVTTFKHHTTVKEALKKFRSLKDRKLYQVFLIDNDGHLTHAVSVQDIAVSNPKELLINLSDRPPISIAAISPREEVVKLLEEKKLINLPVVDINNCLLGVIRNNVLIDAAMVDVTKDVQALFGAGREERALSSVSLAVRKRLPWLQINLATAFLAASVVAIFEDTISRITVLAVFLPVVAGQSGNTGSQALAVTMRGLALREISVNQWFKVARKEILVGVINGVAVAITTSLIVFIWASSFGLAIVIGISMILSMAIAGLSGALIPMILQSMGQDPASSSSIILTTVTDIVGFLSFLGLATALASVLGIV
jgi:magnesium transporter